MSAPYTAEDVRNILEPFVAEYLVDIPATHIGGRMLLAEDDLIDTVFLAERSWFEEIAQFVNEANEEG